MATVYLARDETHSRDVAVKVLLPGVTGALGVDAFVAEIRTTAGLSHPHILTLLDSGQQDGLPFYVAPFVRGESLQDRLRREGSLSLDESLRIGSAVAGALSHAHAEGVIHRDVKPGNILLDRAGNPYLADFGIARALSATDTLRTSSGQVLGTLRYMSPEQISGEEEIDGTTDLYSLSCVVFEMLAGAPPFTASSPRALLAAHLLTPPSSIRTVRADVPGAVDELLQSALSKDPADRIGTAAEFAQRLDDLRTTSRMRQVAPESTSSGDAARGAPRASWRRDRIAYLVGAALLVGVFTLWIAGTLGQGPFGGRLGPFGPGGPALDTTRYVLLAFDHDESLDDIVPVELLLQEAFGRWEGITVVPGFQTSSQTRLTREARELAVAANAGRLVTGRTRAVGDFVRVDAWLLDPTSEEQLGRADFMIGPNALGSDDVVAGAVERLLFGTLSASAGPLLDHTSSVPAGRQFHLGEAALGEWNFAEAERRFTEAARHDPNFNLAWLWQAQVMSWLGADAPEWERAALRAAGAAGDLPPRERRLATALAAMAEGRFPDACAAYDELRDRGDDELAAWFGLGECRRRDPMVIVDLGSPTGWSFRGSGHAAAAFYQDALESLPEVHRAFGMESSGLVHRLLYTWRSLVREGESAAPGSRPFLGYPEWRGDSLVHVAVPRDSSMLFERDREAETEALRHQRSALLDVAHAWDNAFPTSGGAQYTLAVARELLGETTALATYVKARELADADDNPRLRALVGVAEVILRVRLSLAHDLGEIRAAVTLGDSILADAAGGTIYDADQLAALAVLMGRPSLAARLSRDGVAGDGEVVQAGQALLAFAVVGAPVDSIRAHEGHTERLIDRAVPRPEARRAARQTRLEQPSLLAWPIYTLQFLDSIGLVRGPEARTIAELASGNRESAIAMLGGLSSSPGWDVLLSQANILNKVDRGPAALNLLARRLDSLDVADPAEVRGMARLGALVRAAALRAELERELGSHEVAVRWARAVLTLWNEGEEDAVAPVLDRMRGILDSRDRP